MGESFMPLIPEEDREMVKRNINSLDYQKPMITLEHRALKPNGEIAWQQWTKRAIFDDQGRMVECQAVGRDITEMKQVNEALRESEGKFRALAESAPAGILIAVGEKLAYLNPAFESITGFTREEGFKMRFWELVHPDMQELARERGFARLRGESVPSHYELKVLTKDGQTRWIDLTATLINCAGEKAILVIAFDITERKTAEEALKKSEERYRFLVETMNEGFTIVDENQVRTYANKKLSEMLGYELDEIIDHPATILFDKTNTKIWKREFNKRKKGHHAPYEITWRGKDGRKIMTIAAPRAIFDKEGSFRGSFSVITDITRQKLTEKALRKREKELDVKSSNLEEVNTALRVLLKKREEDKTELEERVLFNVREMVEPYLRKLRRSGLDGKQRALLEILESNLNDIISPLSRDLSSRDFNLTPTELKIANLIKQGRNSKQIGEIISLSTRTVEFHRNNIREKLGIKHKKANLRTHLMSL
jgi:PAS domain S-box-containing protein